MARTDAQLRAQRAFRSHSTEATEAFGEALARAIEAQPELVRAGVAVTLEGELGTGKTAVVRGIARGLGSEDAVHSPSFTLMHTYKGRLPVYHFDAWMEGRERAFLEGGGAEWLEDGGVALIEWASRVETWLPLPRLGLILRHVGPSEPDCRLLTLMALAAPIGSAHVAREHALVDLVNEFRLADVRSSPVTPGITEEP